jgi:hypothetical protein
MMIAFAVWAGERYGRHPHQVGYGHGQRVVAGGRGLVVPSRGTDASAGSSYPG